MEAVEKRKVGRPRQEPEEGERIVLSFRVTPALKRLLDGAADRSGRSTSQECELRLERSFEQDRITTAFEVQFRELGKQLKDMQKKLAGHGSKK